MEALYTLLIYPLELLFEVVFCLAGRFVSHPGYAIIVLSLAVSLLVLPLYKRADEVQKKEREIEASLKEGADHIKKTFKGDERMMMLNAYYLQNGYSPLSPLKGTVSLLLQIPFFIAAYRFLSDLKSIRGLSFGPISDLGAADGLLTIGALTINVLPIAMTLINLISGYIYMRGMPKRVKAQTYGITLVFLILLYRSASGLVLYWTCNNIFSLIKNFIYKIKEKFPGSGLPRFKIKTEFTKTHQNVFILSAVFLTVLTGFLIPSAVIRSSPTEFMDLLDIESPNHYVLHSGLIAAGFFMVWGGVFFFLARPQAKVILSRIMWALCPAAAVSYLFFGTDLGTLSSTLLYDTAPVFGLKEQLINDFAVVLASVIFVFIMRRFPRISEVLAFALVAVSLFMSVGNMRVIRSVYRQTKDMMLQSREIPSIPLSTSGRNVMVIMVDRAPGFLVPIIFDELPQLRAQFDGFTFYPNTLSYGAHTKHGTPAMFGGYDYTPQEICRDTDKTLLQTQNEALSVMPVLFRDEGFRVTLCDPPFAGYTYPPDISLFSGEGYEGIDAYITEGNDVPIRAFYGMPEKLLERNFFCYSILKISPLVFQGTIYNNGKYNAPDAGIADGDSYTIPQIEDGPSRSTGVTDTFMNAYAVLENLPDMTDVTSESIDTFMYINNKTAHDTMLLSEPSYVPMQNVNNEEYDAEHSSRFDDPVGGFYLKMDSYNTMRHYESNAAAYIMLGRYFDFMRQSGVWDNTRIIIAADHGTMYADVAFFGLDTRISDSGIDPFNPVSGIEAFNPVLMVKDFGSTGFYVDEKVMVNADIPFIATQGLVGEQVNPFTGNPLITHESIGFPVIVYDSNDSNVMTDTEAGPDAVRFVVDKWYAFDGQQLYDLDSWTTLGAG